ncbi:hypothetical protein RJ641_009313 [Dillenia turbinata]|uniref:BHLH domain-containing protein n=1 Tax=Dillenia turbinata TaxID=194707 RepID=A0AAN8VCQ1_9MAGN
MDCEVPSPSAEKGNAAPELSENRSNAGKNSNARVPKRIHKAEREKMKREQLNELFLDLANAFDLNEENHGKASILGEATRILKDMLAQIESLKKENAVLLSEAHYVANEKNELREETSAMESKVEKLRTEVQERLALSKPDLNVTPEYDDQTDLPLAYMKDGPVMPPLDPSLQQTHLVAPFLVIPIGGDVQHYSGTNVTQDTSSPRVHVSKPHARYPSVADSWPLQLLETTNRK